MHQDTVVGIVGAAVLVSVMIGVFVYEYNNVEDGSEPDGFQGFEEAFPTLNATGDIDCDGTVNAEDDDIDGDGTANAEDDETSYHSSSSGTLGPGTPLNQNSYSHGFCVDAGNMGGTVTLSVAPNAPTDGGFVIELVFPDGSIEQRSASGVEFTLDAGTEPGSYTVRVRTDGASPGGSVEASSHIMY